MKTNRLLRVLSVFAFLLLFAPFYDSCSSRPEEAPEQPIGSNEPAPKEITIPIFDIDPFNAFEIASLGYLAIRESTPQEIKLETSKAFQQKDWYKDLGMVVSLIFDFIVVITALMLILSFTKKIKPFSKLALANCILILLTFAYVIFLEKSFLHWAQIKWGYYAFIVTNLLIFYYSKKSAKQS